MDVLNCDVTEKGLHAGDVGAVVVIYQNGKVDGLPSDASKLITISMECPARSESGLCRHFILSGKWSLTDCTSFIMHDESLTEAADNGPSLNRRDSRAYVMRGVDVVDQNIFYRANV